MELTAFKVDKKWVYIKCPICTGEKTEYHFYSSDGSTENRMIEVPDCLSKSMFKIWITDETVRNRVGRPKKYTTEEDKKKASSFQCKKWRLNYPEKQRESSRISRAKLIMNSNSQPIFDQSVLSKLTPVHYPQFDGTTPLNSAPIITTGA